MDNRDSLSKYRIEQADRCLKSASLLLEDGDIKGAANRAYYCIFHCMRSVLALESKDFAKHSGVSSYFRREYIKTGIFSSDLSDIISEALDIRSDSDYDDFYEIDLDEVMELINHSTYFYECIKNYLEKRPYQESN